MSCTQIDPLIWRPRPRPYSGCCLRDALAPGPFTLDFCHGYSVLVLCSTPYLLLEERLHPKQVWAVITKFWVVIQQCTKVERLLAKWSVFLPSGAPFSQMFDSHPSLEPLQTINNKITTKLHIFRAMCIFQPLLAKACAASGQLIAARELPTGQRGPNMPVCPDPSPHIGLNRIHP